MTMPHADCTAEGQPNCRNIAISLTDRVVSEVADFHRQPSSIAGPLCAKRKSHLPCPAHAGCVTASGTASCFPCRNDRAIAELYADRLLPIVTKLRTSL